MAAQSLALHWAHQSTQHHCRLRNLLSLQSNGGFFPGGKPDRV